MTRKKVKLSWIVNEGARKASLRKRRAGLLKKVSELTTLCGVNACALIYSPEEREPQMWPSRPVVEQLLARFNNMPEMEKSKKMMNQETYLKERVGKAQDQLKKQDRKNKEMNVSQVMEKLHELKTIDDFNANELQGLIWFSLERMKDIRKRIEYHQQLNPTTPPHPQLPSPAAVDNTSAVIESNGREGRNPPESGGLWDQWFIDMINNSENAAGSSSAKAKSDAGLTSHQALATSSGAASQMGLPPVNPREYNIVSAIGMSHENPRACNIGSAIGSRSLHGGNDGDMSQPQENSNSDSSSMRLPSELFGGSIAGSDVGMPYDVSKQWPGKFYP